MAFDKKAFMRTKFEQRTEGVKTPSLADWFKGDAEFIVRGLTSSELARANEAANRNNTMVNLATAISANKDQIDEIRNAIGLGDDVPQEIAKRIEMLHLGAVEPKLEINEAVKLAESFTIEFMMLTNKITELTGLGSVEKKQKPTGKTAK